MIGQVIGSFRIEQKIGEGGMGAVYRGRDLMLEREVAIKALRPELARQPELVARFRTEAVTLAKLNHSNIATLYNFLRTGDDFFMAMEFVRGRTLDEIIREEGAMEIERAIRLFCQALEGIAHAHAYGIIHRDIKPANVMLTASDVVKVMDFGIARVLGTARQTKTGRLIGTLEYMSPEQMRGQETDARADIYSLGILLYEMLTGRVPFECDSDYELMRAQVEDQPPSPREFNGNLPLPVELAVLRALAKEPAARFQSAAEFRAALISAIPAAAIKSDPVQPVFTAEPTIKATRLASNPDELDGGYDRQSAEDLLNGTRTPQSRSRNSGFDVETGTFTLKLPLFVLSTRQKIESRFGPLNWKHYGAAVLAVITLSVGLSTLRDRNQKPASELRRQESIVVEPAPVPSMPSIQPLPAMEPFTDVQSGHTSKPVAVRKPKSLSSRPTAGGREVFPPTRPLPLPASTVTMQPAPAPKASPTPKQNKTAEVINAVGNAAEKFGGIFKKKKSKD